MAKIDQFESIFRAASKQPFVPETVEFSRILVVTDLDDQASQPFWEESREFLSALGKTATHWQLLAGSAFNSIKALLDHINEYRPDLICTYRNLHIPASEFPYSLGAYVDVLTQATTTPVLLMPRPDGQSEFEMDQLKKMGTAKVMAITDHLAGDHRLVNVATSMVKAGGKLFLSHVEDEYAVERVLQAIDRIAELDSDLARELIPGRLLTEPRDYIESCRKLLAEHELEVCPVVTTGHLLKDHLKLVEQHEIDLLVMHTKDEDQLAMHGLAYPLAVEMRDRPLLLI